MSNKQNYVLAAKILEKSLPILSKAFEEEYMKLTKIFQEIITSLEEPKNFLKSPIKYLKERGLLSFNSIDLPNGETIPLYDDEQMRKTIREAREEYHSDHCVNIPDFPIGRDTVVYQMDYAVSVNYVAAITAVAVRDVVAYVSGISIDNIKISPLMSPESGDKLKDFLSKELNDQPVNTNFFRP